MGTKNNPTNGCAEECHRKRGQCVTLKTSEIRVKVNCCRDIIGGSRRLIACALPDMVYDEYIRQRTHQQGTLSCYSRRLHRVENRST
ncbi:uncharacterized protein LAESUDRAFT_730016 [Laetiporus sulphureus 93-53]|uniref:Uncharacterized protein n=1 Tax=Laetiporus sulphureus 93-53 TaxID=1314785 RepID=A0A165CBQ5_9APHY|nr:uncharacterized protein LAESUDRAFT_730016 [Laetiporus sulphureus 93-53]KZT02521.1 hypothetical protein LAESUDRAFT_730016 [Laetiporus sulphureus 93-53]